MIDVRAASTAYRSADEEARRAAVAQVEAADGAIAFLVEALGDDGWRVRKEAAARLAGWRDRPRAAEALVDGLGEPDNVGRRNAAIEALVAIGSEAVDPLTRALAGKPEHRKVLIDTLGLIGDSSGAAALEPFLEDGDANVQVAAAEALGQIGGAQAQAALKRALGRPAPILLALAVLDGLNRSGAHLALADLAPLAGEPMLRAAVLEAMARSGDPNALPRLAAALADPGRNVRESAIRALADLHARIGEEEQKRFAAALPLDPAAVQALVQALLEGTLGVQRAAAQVLGLLRRVEAVRPLVLALGDAELREPAARALVAIGSRGLETLVALAPDLESRLRAEVYALLPRFGPQSAEPRVQALLYEALEDEDGDAAAGAAIALGEAGSRDALAPLLRALERGEPLAGAAAVALGRLGTRHYDQVRILISSRGLHGPDAPYLCRVLGACGRAEDAALLRVALGADAPAVRRAAAEALASLPLEGDSSKSREIDEALLFALADESAEVRAQAARALGLHARAMTAEAVDALERAAHDPEIAVRVAAARAVGQIAKAAKSPRALEVLRRLADAPEAAAAVPALEALGQLPPDGDDDARLLRALAGEDAEIVKAATRALGGRAGSRAAAQARKGLEIALADRRWDVRCAAAQALGEHGAPAHPILYAHRSIEKDPLVLEAIDGALKAAMRR